MFDYFTYVIHEKLMKSDHLDVRVKLINVNPMRESCYIGRAEIR